MKTYQNEPNLLRETLVNTMIEYAGKDSRIVALDADLASSSGFGAFSKAFSDRFFNCGIAEANMVGIAAGLSSTGRVPFIHSFGTFASRRVCDQVFISGAYSNAHMIIVGSDPGVTAAYNGGTHMPFEDMAVLRAIPNLKLVEVTDSVMLKGIFAELVNTPAVYYLRLKRKNTPAVYEESEKFTIGKANVLRKGKDASVICSGIMTAEAMMAADMLEAEGINISVVNMHTWKPVDEEVITWCAKETGAIITAENHNVLGGLGGAVCEVVCKTAPCRVERLGIQDEFGEVGTEDYLKKRFKLTAENIAETVKKTVKS